MKTNKKEREFFERLFNINSTKAQAILEFINSKKTDIIDDLKKRWAHEYGNDNIDTESYDIFLKHIEDLEKKHILKYENKEDEK